MSSTEIGYAATSLEELQLNDNNMADICAEVRRWNGNTQSVKWNDGDFCTAMPKSLSLFWTPIGALTVLSRLKHSGDRAHNHTC